MVSESDLTKMQLRENLFTGEKGLILDLEIKIFSKI